MDPPGSMSVQSTPANPRPSDFNITLPSTASAPNISSPPPQGFQAGQLYAVIIPRIRATCIAPSLSTLL
jgi:hypothetical protein